jgi:hypothetical protein
LLNAVKDMSEETITMITVIDSSIIDNRNLKIDGSVLSHNCQSSWLMRTRQKIFSDDQDINLVVINTIAAPVGN